MAYVRVDEEVHAELWELKYDWRANSINEVIKKLLEFYEKEAIADA